MSQSEATWNTYQPTIKDIIDVKNSLWKALPIPPELIDEIMDVASYWAHSSLELSIPCSIPFPEDYDKMYMRSLPLAIRGTDGDVEINEPFQLDTYSAELQESGKEEVDWLPPRGEQPCRKIVFTIASHDQGYSGETEQGTYANSWTWFDASVERLESGILDHGSGKSVTWPGALLNVESDAASPLLTDPDSKFKFIRRDPEHPFQHPPTHIQRNLQAVGESHTHTVTWTHTDYIQEGSAAAIEADSRGQGWQSLDGHFVRSLKVGECITLWMRARFPGWRNNVQSAKIDVYWAV